MNKDCKLRGLLLINQWIDHNQCSRLNIISILKISEGVINDIITSLTRIV